MDQIENGLKLVMRYNIEPESAQDYYQFIIGQYIPVMQTMGLEVTEAWHTAYGDYPNRLIVFVSRDDQTARQVVNDPAWEELNDRLLEYVTDFDYKIIPYSVGFQF
ncbi:MAG: hypothetical protein PVH65_13040 [Chloroflexota bacterium]